jgi:hypothetical protein
VSCHLTCTDRAKWQVVEIIGQQNLLSVESLDDFRENPMISQLLGFLTGDKSLDSPSD